MIIMTRSTVDPVIRDVNPDIITVNPVITALLLGKFSYKKRINKENRAMQKY